MVMSLKPFGCMPSTQSDGAQAAVIAHFPQMIYIPIETSGEGDINAHSRAQMALGEAKIKCKSEFKASLEKAGHTLDAIRRYVADRPELKTPLLKVPSHKGVVGKAANFVLEVGRLMDGDATLSKTGATAGAITATPRWIRRISSPFGRCRNTPNRRRTSGAHGSGNCRSRCLTATATTLTTRRTFRRAPVTIATTTVCPMNASRIATPMG